MAATLPRAVAILEELVGKPDGVALGGLAETLGLPKSATHRLVTELVELGYVRQEVTSGRYALGLRIVSMALRHLRDIPLVDLAGPALQRLADESGELARLSVADGEELFWVAKRQGAKSGLKYDPDSGSEVILASTSSGLAWLSTLSDERALALVDRQVAHAGDGAPRGADLLHVLAEVRVDGYAYRDSTFERGLAGVAVPIAESQGSAVGVLSVAGPSVRFSEREALAILPALLECAAALAPLARHESIGAGDRWA